MTDKYWVGGTGTWDTTTTTNWSLTSGGAGGAAVPTASDNVFFNASSGTPSTVTMTGALTCLSFTTSVTGWTFATGTTPTLAVSGSMSLTSTTTWTSTGTITFNSTTTGNTITTGGTSFAAAITFNGVGGAWSLGSAFTTTLGVTLTAGTLDTSSSGNYALTCQSFTSSGTGTRTLNLNASTVTLNSGGGGGTGSFWSTSVINNFTFNAGTSNISVAGVSTNGAMQFNDGGLTFYNFTMQVGMVPGYSQVGLNFVNTSATNFHNLTLTAPTTATAAMPVPIAANFTVSNAFTVTGGGYNYRIVLDSTTPGATRTITAASASLTYVDFQDITGAGAATWSGTSLGNAGGNSNITFTAAKTVYFVGTTSASWGATTWATSSGGATAVANFPLPQDTVYIDNNSLNTSATLTVTHWYFGTVTFVNRTNAITLSIDSVHFISGSFVLNSSVTVTTNNNMLFENRGTYQLNTNGVSFPSGTQAMIVNAVGGTVQLLSAFTTLGNFTLTYGTLDCNGYNFTCANFGSSNSNTRSILFGSGTFTITGSGTAAWNTGTITGLTATVSTATISMTNTSAKTFAGGGGTFPTLNQGGAGTLTISGSNTFNNISNSYSATAATAITFTASTTQTVGGFTATGASGKILTLASSTAGTFNSIVLTGGGKVSVDYLSVKDSHVTPATTTWYAGANSTNVSGNTGWIFTVPPSGTVNSGFFIVMG